MYKRQEFVETLPPLPYRAALEEMIRADALLVLQASNCNEQIPAKLYEYLRAGRPIVALSDPLGDTASLLHEAGVDTIARLDSIDGIAELLARFLDRAATRRAGMPDEKYVVRCARYRRTQILACLLDRASAGVEHSPNTGALAPAEP